MQTDFRSLLLRAPEGAAGGSAAGASGTATGAAAASATGGAAPGAGTQGDGAAAGSAAAPSTTSSWYAPFNLEKDHSDYIDQHKFDGLPSLLKSTMTFDALARGRNVMEKPDPKKPQEWKGYTELGYIEDAGKYAAAVTKPAATNGGPPVNDAIFAEVVKAGHEVKVAPWQLAKIYDHVYQVSAQAEKDAAAKEAGDQAALKEALAKEWGPDTTHHTELATRAFKTLAPGDEVAGELEKIIGAPRLLKFFHKLGAMLGEDQLMVTGGQGNALASESPGTIERQLRELEQDREKFRALSDQRHPMHKDVTAQRTRLIERLAAAQARSRPAA